MASRYLLIVFLFAWKPDCLVKSEWCEVKYSKDRIDDPEYLKKCIPKPWKPFFEELQKKSNGVFLLKRLADDLINISKQLEDAIEPQMPLLFRAFELVEPEKVRVVILGQDPTPQKDKATGVAFHVEKPRSVPAVLHMFLEVAFEGFPVDLDKGNVMEWARQGVLLLNTALTCPHKPPNEADEEDRYKYRSHSKIWEAFTISLIKHIEVKTAGPSVWLLWGREAKKFSTYINKKQLIIEGGHPSPTGTAKHGDSFFGGNYFNGANQFLRSNERGTIDWSLSDSGLNSLKLTPENWKKKLLSPVSESGLNSLKLIPENWEQQLKNEKIKLEYELNEEMIQEERELRLRNRLKQINYQLQRIPYEQLKCHYEKIITKLPE
ncbi:uncharacterized protein LOC113668427 [Pocillopora damicornis]|uniref:uncharacterized protein LOC113668427 n=1 Tax=Pocillopora damicornis TaxID=46731 RepID=UPI000F551361|nr:uncharacterized protein LOC113668427 [Pocillopora damicornis]